MHLFFGDAQASAFHGRPKPLPQLFQPKEEAFDKIDVGKRDRCDLGFAPSDLCVYILLVIARIDSGTIRR
jgi:hypothetical protein